MTSNKENAAILGVGVAACAVCCAGPILGVLAAIGLGTTVGFALFGTIAIVLAAAITVMVVIRRRRPHPCAPTEPTAVTPVELTTTHSRPN
jgi:mercuric ion transport protein